MRVTRSWLSAVVTSVITVALVSRAYGQPPSAAPDDAAAQVVEIVGRVETLDSLVVGITFQGDTEPTIGDLFEVFLTTPSGDRGRVAKGKITFAKNGVLLGRCDEATGEIAVGLEVRIANSQPAFTPCVAGENPRDPSIAAVRRHTSDLDRKLNGLNHQRRGAPA